MTPDENPRMFWLDRLKLLQPFIGANDLHALALAVHVEWNPQMGRAYRVERVKGDVVLHLHPAMQNWYTIEQAEVCLSAGAYTLIMFINKGQDPTHSIWARCRQLGFCCNAALSPRERWRQIFVGSPATLLGHLEDRPICGLCMKPVASQIHPGPAQTTHHECMVFATQVLKPAIQAERARQKQENASND